MPTHTLIEPEPEQDSPIPSSTTGLTVEGMTCGNCARHVREAIQGVSGVNAVSVDLASHKASVR
ncbi:MAG TPA: heavy metal-associated domain-containing protein, partial [Terriglobia bacterium]|nr:heavy metal-associated domain-containing protein [Terriglobia bacterium]